MPKIGRPKRFRPYSRRIQCSCAREIDTRRDEEHGVGEEQRAEAEVDVAVVGAGFGGLACALRLAEQGAQVALFERLSYPGGCASTFRRRGQRHESGATLFSGLGPEGLFGRWIERHGLEVAWDRIDPLVELRAQDLALSVPRNREALLERFEALPVAPRAALRRFFGVQRRVSDALWALFDDPSLLPPLNLASLARHLGRSPRYLELVRWVGRPLGALLGRLGLENFAPLRIYLDGLCQITVQTSSDRAEAPFALAAGDYYFRGTGHVRGGIGRLAKELVSAIEALGGRVHLADEVRTLRPLPGSGGWQVESRRRTLRASAVVANLLPAGLAGLAGLEIGRNPVLGPMQRRLEREGWGAAMLYLTLRPRGAGPPPPGPPPGARRRCPPALRRGQPRVLLDQRRGRSACPRRPAHGHRLDPRADGQAAGAETRGARRLHRRGAAADAGHAATAGARGGRGHRRRDDGQPPDLRAVHRPRPRLSWRAAPHRRAAQLPPAVARARAPGAVHGG